jgi:DNA polymerase
MTNATNNRGCSVSEALRRYYLDAMGIQVWQARDAVVAGKTQQPSAGVPAHNIAAGADWHLLQQQVAACIRCPLHTTRTQTVFGVGNQRAEVMVIGEAPGQDEDAQGEPFVGRAGQLLDAMLAAIGFVREQVYIANIIKCRPPNNRNPHAEEVAHCIGYLRQQIALVQPKIIFAIGKIAAHSLLQIDATVAAMRGELYDYEGISVIVSYHPAYLLRAPGEKRKAWQDLLHLKRLLN